jgi:YD repeat-containing protein
VHGERSVEVGGALVDETDVGLAQMPAELMAVTRSQGRISHVWSDGADLSPGADSYSYDAAGRLTGYTLGAVNGVTYASCYDGASDLRGV